MHSCSATAEGLTEGPTDDQSTLLVEISRIAHLRARELTHRQDADDVAQDVVLECLLQLESGKLGIHDVMLEAFVGRLVATRAIDMSRRTRRRGKREETQAVELNRRTHSWMSPEDTLYESTLDELYAEMLANLPATCRRVYSMVREQDATYQSVANQLGITESAVSRHVVKAQHRIRENLAAYGISAPPPRRGGASRMVHPSPPVTYPAPHESRAGRLMDSGV